MKGFLTLSLLAVFGLASAVAGHISMPHTHKTLLIDHCSKYVLIATRGIREAQSDLPGAFKTTINNVLFRVSGSRVVNTVYPTNATLIDQPVQIDYARTSVGVNWIRDFLNRETQVCPDQSYALLGFSEGAIINSFVLDTYQGTGVDKRIKAVLFAGNPFHTPNLTGNVDENGGNLTHGAEGESISAAPAGVRTSSESGRVLDFCFLGDTICNKAGSGPEEIHHSYGKTPSVQRIGTDFLIRHLGGK
ncbi:hypothetical protein OC846_003900 [Tilletia horrida]|uniref:Cutinase n=1 Tax=Tilletia horrida TaxID=155126 RepID=A0AAN6GP55_9BASI|nr:hypothetical protein OC846_003900 [Tilletia horrida]KAK0553951.1 hypothetical protein OC845_000940 [Tilletia horrida]KAK0565335.1 hypothetical protein OC861_003809 [Tilletia horrida]